MGNMAQKRMFPCLYIKEKRVLDICVERKEGGTSLGLV